EQRHDRRRMAKARAVVDVVRAKAGAHQLLEEVRLLVGALRRAEDGERIAVLLADLFQAGSSKVQRLFPACLAEHFVPVRRIGLEVRGLREPRLAHETLAQSLPM